MFRESRELYLWHVDPVFQLKPVPNYSPCRAHPIACWCNLAAHVDSQLVGLVRPQAQVSSVPEKGANLKGARSTGVWSKAMPQMKFVFERPVVRTDELSFPVSLKHVSLDKQGTT